MRKYRLISFLLGLVLIIQCVPVYSLAAMVEDSDTGNIGVEEQTRFDEVELFAASGDYQYTVDKDEGTATIKRYAGTESNILIPSSIDGYTVTAIGKSAFENCTTVTSVTIPSTVETIGTWAFYGCSNLTDISFPASILSTGRYAFYRLESLNVHISDLAMWCQISFGQFGNPLENGGSLYCNGQLVTELVIPTGITTIPASAFNGCTSITSVTIPNSVMDIGASAFSECQNLTDVVIPNSVKEIKGSTFYECNNLKSITIPETITTIGEWAFYQCTSLTDVYITDISSWCKIDFQDSTSQPLYYGQANMYCNGELVTELEIPEGINEMRPYVFYGCSSLEKISLPTSVTIIGMFAFGSCANLREVMLPESLTSIGYEAFSRCSSLEQINFPNSIIEIGSCAFFKCHGLTSIDISGSGTTIGSMAFYNCSSLTEITLTGYISSIDKEAFAECSSLSAVHISSLYDWCRIRFSTSDSTPLYRHAADLYCNGSKVTDVTIPDGITEILPYCFAYWPDLKNVTIPNSATSIGRMAFYECENLVNVTIPDSVVTIDQEVFSYCYNLANVTLPDGIVTIGNNAFSFCESLTGISIPQSVTSIGSSAFKGCDNLAEVVIPQGVTIIEASTFESCSSLVNVTIPDSVVTIGICAFENCSNLQNVTLPASVTSIGYMAFSGSGLTSINIPNNVTVIDFRTFEYCDNLTSVMIPRNVTSIGTNAFNYCQNLSDIFFLGSAPSLTPASSGNRSFPQSTALHYIENTIGWKNSEYYDAEVGTWNGYKLDIWNPEDMGIDLKKPLINPISISSNKIIAGSMVEFFTVASDNLQLTSVKMYIDDVLVDTVGTTEDYAKIQYSTAELTVGSHVVKVVAIDAGENSNETSSSVEVLPVTPGTIYEVNISSYEFDAGTTVTFTVVTTTDTAKLRLLDGTYAFREVTEGYSDSYGKRTWVFDQYVGSAGVDRMLRVESYVSAWTGNWCSVTFTARAALKLGTISILTPDGSSIHAPNSDMMIEWTAPDIVPDQYVVHVGDIDSSYISVHGTTATVSGAALTNGVYPITVIAQKAGYSDSTAFTQFTVACQHVDATKGNNRYDNYQYNNTMSHLLRVTPTYQCNTCSAIFADEDSAYYTTSNHTVNLLLSNGVWICKCGFINMVASEIMENCCLKNGDKQKVYKSISSSGKPITSYGEVWNSDVFRVLGTTGEYSLIEYDVDNFNSHVNGMHRKKAGFIKTSFIGTIQESDPGIGETPVVNESEYRIYCPSAYKRNGELTLHLPKGGQTWLCLVDINNGGKVYELQEVKNKTVEWISSSDKPFYEIDTTNSIIKYYDNAFFSNTDVSALTLRINGVDVQTMTIYSGHKAPSVELLGKSQLAESYVFRIGSTNYSDVIECGIIYSTCDRTKCDKNPYVCGMDDNVMQQIVATTDVKRWHEVTLGGTHGFAQAYVATPYGIYYSKYMEYKTLSYELSRAQYEAETAGTLSLPYETFLELRPIAIFTVNVADQLVAIAESGSSATAKLSRSYEVMQNYYDGLTTVALDCVSNHLQSYEGVYADLATMNKIRGIVEDTFGTYVNYESSFGQYLIDEAINYCLDETYDYVLSQLPFSLQSEVFIKEQGAMFLSSATGAELLQQETTSTSVFEEVPCFNTSISRFKNGYAVAEAENGTTRIIDKSNRVIHEMIDAYSTVLGNKYFVYSTVDGVTVCDYNGTQVYSLQGAYLCSEISNDEYLLIYSVENERYGVIRIDGSVVLPFVYADIMLSGAMAIGAKNNTWNLIDLQTAQVVYVADEGLSFLGPDTVKTVDGSKFGIMDHTGKILLECKYDSIEYDSTYYCLTESTDEYGDTMCSLLDDTLNVMFTFNGSLLSYNDGVVVYTDSGSGDFIISDLNGNVFCTKSPEEVHTIGTFVGGMAFEQDQYGGFRYIDPYGRYLSDQTYNYAFDFANGYAVVYTVTDKESDGSSIGHYSIIDTNFNVIRDIETSVCYDSAYEHRASFGDGYLLTIDQQTGLMGYIILRTDNQQNSATEYSFTLVSNTSNTATVSFNAKNVNNGSVKVIVAGYNSNGKMVTYATQNVTGSSRIPLVLEWVAEESVSMVKGFVLDALLLMPLDDAWTQNIGRS